MALEEDTHPCLDEIIIVAVHDVGDGNDERVAEVVVEIMHEDMSVEDEWPVQEQPCGLHVLTIKLELFHHLQHEPRM